MIALILFGLPLFVLTQVKVVDSAGCCECNGWWDCGDPAPDCEFANCDDCYGYNYGYCVPEYSDFQGLLSLGVVLSASLIFAYLKKA